MQTYELLFSGLEQRAVLQQDELVILRHWAAEPMSGAVAGIELQKELTHTALRQAKAEFLLAACTSHFPYIQVGASYGVYQQLMWQSR